MGTRAGPVFDVAGCRSAAPDPARLILAARSRRPGPAARRGTPRRRMVDGRPESWRTIGRPTIVGQVLEGGMVGMVGRPTLCIYRVGRPTNHHPPAPTGRAAP